ncbi:transcription factor IIIB 50 kDa subunit [Halichoeres trimaculatus]|uniref:transcription factor IIIB 50 kDa subunit n=1 Tax=Halichoeres trimaculatus TaxID=147232 RepID=UPI003D9E257D
MSGSGLVCPGCGSSNIVDDDLYAQAQMVCVDCGSVVSEGVLANDPVGGLDVSYRQTTAITKKPCRNLLRGLQRVKAMCRILCVHREIEELSHTHYNQAYQHESFIKVSLQKKEVLAGCCVLLSCRMLNWPISMGTIGNLVDADPTLMGAVYQEMVKVLKIEAPLVCVMDLMEAHCHEYKISSNHVPEELAEDSRNLSKRAVALVELAADTWIVTGRRPIPVMMAAIYLAWQSMKPNKLRLKLTLDKFCKLAKVKKQPKAIKRVTEIKEVLCKLGKEIPWVREEVTPDNVVLQVEDILNHKHALLRKAMRSHEDALLAEDSLTEENTDAASEEQSELNTDTGERDNSSCIKPGQQDDSQESPDTTTNWGKRVLFAPPCVVHAKRRRVEQSGLKDVTGDEEISDTEIDSYIRTPRETREFALAQKILLESEES